MIRPFRPDDIRHLGLSAEQSSEAMNHLDEMAEGGWTFEREGQLMMCGGELLISGWYARMWTLFGDRMSLMMWREPLAAMREWIGNSTLPRLESHVETGYPAWVRFNRHLGFEVEGRLSNLFGPERDGFVMARPGGRYRKEEWT